MSRVGKMPVTVPAGVAVEINGQSVKAKGPKGELAFTMPKGVSAKLENNIITVESKGNSKEARSNHGTARARIANIVAGANQEFKKELIISGLGYRASVQGQMVNLQLGFSHDVNYELPKGVKAELDGKKNILTLTGPDKVTVGAAAANIRGFRKTEPYKGKGIKYTDEHVIRKAGKAAGGAGAKK